MTTNRSRVERYLEKDSSLWTQGLKRTFPSVFKASAETGSSAPVKGLLKDFRGASPEMQKAMAVGMKQPSAEMLSGDKILGTSLKETKWGQAQSRRDPFTRNQDKVTGQNLQDMRTLAGAPGVDSGFVRQQMGNIREPAYAFEVNKTVGNFGPIAQTTPTMTDASRLYREAVRRGDLKAQTQLYDVSRSGKAR